MGRASQVFRQLPHAHLGAEEAGRAACVGILAECQGQPVPFGGGRRVIYMRERNSKPDIRYVDNVQRKAKKESESRQ